MIEFNNSFYKQKYIVKVCYFFKNLKQLLFIMPYHFNSLFVQNEQTPMQSFVDFAKEAVGFVSSWFVSYLVCF